MVLNTREKILEAFFELSMENPQKSHFSLAEIAQKAGISRQAIYKRHFNGNYEILDYIHKELDAEFFKVMIRKFILILLSFLQKWLFLSYTPTEGKSVVSLRQQQIPIGEIF